MELILLEDEKTSDRIKYSIAKFEISLETFGILFVCHHGSEFISIGSPFMYLKQ